MTHYLHIPDFQPRRLNELLGHWAKRTRLKRGDRNLIAHYARVYFTPLALCKRRVSLKITLAPRQRAPDPDAYWKSVLDALVACDLLLDDNRQHVELGRVEFERGPERHTTIVLEDLEE